MRFWHLAFSVEFWGTGSGSSKIRQKTWVTVFDLVVGARVGVLLWIGALVSICTTWSSTFNSYAAEVDLVTMIKVVEKQWLKAKGISEDPGVHGSRMRHLAAVNSFGPAGLDIILFLL